MKMIGIGACFDTTNGVEFYDQAEIGFTLAKQTLEIPRGDTFGMSKIPISLDLKGRVGFRDLRSGVLASFLGTATTLGGIKAEERIPLVIAASSGVLVSTPYTALAVRIIDTNGKIYNATTGVPGSGQYAISGRTITIDSSLNSSSVYVTYFWTDTVAGRTVKVSPVTIGGSFGIQAYLKAYDTDRRQWLPGGFGAKLASCEWEGDLSFGTSRGEAATFGVDFSTDIRDEDDALFYFPGDANQT
jgi:hypothetical protein